MIHVARLVQIDGRFCALGRVFSGTAASGMKVRILGEQYQPEGKADLYETNLQYLGVVVGGSGNFKRMLDVPCGNIVLLTSIEKYINHTATITDCFEAFPFRVVRSY